MATVGFPDPSLQGFSPKVLAHGHHGGNRVAVRRGGWPALFSNQRGLCRRPPCRRAIRAGRWRRIRQWWRHGNWLSE